MRNAPATRSECARVIRRGSSSDAGIAERRRSVPRSQLGASFRIRRRLSGPDTERLRRAFRQAAGLGPRDRLQVLNPPISARIRRYPTLQSPDVFGGPAEFTKILFAPPLEW